MNNRDFKINLINALLSRNIYTERPSNIQIRTRCPFCGDSQKNFHTGHLYLRINPNDNYPIVYHCFKCPAEGILKYEDLELLGIEDNNIKDGLNVLNKTSDKIQSGNSYNENAEKYFEYKIPTNYNLKKIEYIENRLKYRFTEEELQNIKVLTSLKDFLILNDINTITCKPYIANMIEDKYVGFLSNSNSHILFRDITDTQDIRWYKYPITHESQGQKVFYSIKSSIDLYTTDKIIVNLSEGVMDALSICYNLENNKENTLNIAVCGKFYLNIMKYLIGQGIVGSNVILNIYSDQDYTQDTSIEYYRQVFKKYTHLLGEINVFYNLLSKDCGVEKDKIKLHKYLI